MEKQYVKNDKVIGAENYPDKEISTVYFGYLVGQVREVLEAAIADERQLKALKGVMDDKLYGWWDGAYTPDGGRIIDPGDPRKQRELGK